jgi:hypothetical protein
MAQAMDPLSGLTADLPSGLTSPAPLDPLAYPPEDRTADVRRSRARAEGTVRTRKGKHGPV